ncbi:histidinol dehydrogenase [Candidatus Vidania fulgoroideorum]
MRITNGKKFIKKFNKNKNILKLEKKIESIKTQIINKGEKYLKKCILKYDNIRIYKKFYKKTKNLLNSNKIKLIKKFIKRVKKFHVKQKKKIGNKSWQIKDKYFNFLGQKCSAINKVLIYVPGGNYSYISTLIMNVIPAVLAGVKHIYITSPAKGKNFIKISSVCKILKINRIFRIGGAHAVIAFALGTKHITKVDKIVGPGNDYVNIAKKNVFGMVGIDSLAGPTEILIITDGSYNISNIINDVYAQLEHDINSKAFIVSFNYSFLKTIIKRIQNSQKNIKNKILINSIKNIEILYLKNLDRCISFSNKIAPEHLEYLCKNKKKINNLKNFGSLFVGNYSCEGIGDYFAGANHVLPTNSNSKFSSPLCINDFLKLSNIIIIKKKGFKKIGIPSAQLANFEGLLYHKKSINERITTQ